MNAGFCIDVNRGPCHKKRLMCGSLSMSNSRCLCGVFATLGCRKTGAVLLCLVHSFDGIDFLYLFTACALTSRVRRGVLFFVKTASSDFGAYSSQSAVVYMPCAVEQRRRRRGSASSCRGVASIYGLWDRKWNFVGTAHKFTYFVPTTAIDEHRPAGWTSERFAQTADLCATAQSVDSNEID